MAKRREPQQQPTIDKQKCFICRQPTLKNVVLLYPCYHVAHGDCLNDASTCLLCLKKIDKRIPVGESNLAWNDKTDGDGHPVMEKEEHKKNTIYFNLPMYLRYSSTKIQDVVRAQLTRHYTQHVIQTLKTPEDYVTLYIQSQIWKSIAGSKYLKNGLNLIFWSCLRFKSSNITQKPV